MSEGMDIFGTVIGTYRSPENILDQEIVTITTRPRYKIANENPDKTLYILRGCHVKDIELHNNFKNLGIHDIVHIELSSKNIPVQIEIITRF